MMDYTCTKFHDYILNGIRVMERTRKVNGQTDRQRARHNTTRLRQAYNELIFQFGDFDHAMVDHSPAGVRKAHTAYPDDPSSSCQIWIYLYCYSQLSISKSQSSSKTADISK